MITCNSISTCICNMCVYKYMYVYIYIYTHIHIDVCVCVCPPANRCLLRGSENDNI